MFPESRVYPLSRGRDPHFWEMRAGCGLGIDFFLFHPREKWGWRSLNEWVAQLGGPQQSQIRPSSSIREALFVCPLDTSICLHKESDVKWHSPRNHVQLFLDSVPCVHKPTRQALSHTPILHGTPYPRSAHSGKQSVHLFSANRGDVAHTQRNHTVWVEVQGSSATPVMCPLITYIWHWEDLPVT